MAFQQGLSGLNASSKAIDVTSNNIANASTVGFKMGNAQFADVYASALSGASTGLQIGIGTTVNAVRQAFTQGNLSTSNNPLDLAINGNGFFRVQRGDGSVAYTRNGQFDIDKDGYIVTAIGDRLNGYPVEIAGAASVFAGTASAIRIDTSNIEPKPTGNTVEVDLATGLRTLRPDGGGVEIIANFNSSDVNPTLRTPPGPPFVDPPIPPAVGSGLSEPPKADSYNFTRSLQVFDSLGNAHTLSFYFVKATTVDPGGSIPPTFIANSTWEVYIYEDGNEPVSINPALISYDAFGKASPANVIPYTLVNGPQPQTFPIDLTKTTQYGAPSAITSLAQNGFTTGQLTGLIVTKDGVVQGRYSNGQSSDIAKVALATFRSPNGLISLGNNLWAASPDSGPEVIGSPGTGVLGVISAGQVEESNVDLTQELVQLIVQQRNYQANAQSIRTQDQILQTLVNLR